MSVKHLISIISILVLFSFHSATKIKPTAATPSGCALPPENMIGWWQGNGNAQDFLGVHPGTIGENANFVPGQVKEAFNFDGTDDYISVLDNIPDAQLDGFDELTIDAWIYPYTQFWQNSDGFLNAIVSKYNTTLSDGVSYNFILNNGYIRLSIFQSVSPEIWAGLQANTAIPIDQWSHVAGVWRGGTTFELYINGVEVSGTIRGTSPDPGNFTMAENDVPVNFGRVESFSGSSSGPSAYYHGLIDEVEIFNRALSADEILSIYAAGNVGKCTNTTLLPFMITEQN